MVDEWYQFFVRLLNEFLLDLMMNKRVLQLHWRLEENEERWKWELNVGQTSMNRYLKFNSMNGESLWFDDILHRLYCLMLILIIIIIIEFKTYTTCWWWRSFCFRRWINNRLKSSFNPIVSICILKVNWFDKSKNRDLPRQNLMVHRWN